MSVQPMKRVASLCRDMLFHKMLSGAAYGAEANIYNPPTIADLELSTPQRLLLALLYSLVTGDLMSSIFLAEICHRVQQLRSRHLRVWLLEDFEFPRTDVETAMSLLGQVVADGTLKLPTHVMTIMTSLAKKYRITSVQLRTLSEECRSEMEMQLENAVINNCPRDIFDLESEGAEVSALTRSGDSLLHLAARTGSSSSIAALCILNADVECVNSSNVSPLEEAVRCNCAASVKTLLKAGAKLDKCLIGGDTYLHIAAAGGHNKALEVLLEGGMDVNETNQHKETPLAQAVRTGNVRGIALLKNKGADFSALSGLRLSNGDSIVHSVARSGNIEMLKLLKDKKIPANIKNQDGLTPLHVASDTSVARILLRMGVEVDTQDSSGSTPLMVAAKNSKEDIVTLLLINKADPTIKDNEGRSALHYAAEGGCTGSVAILLDARVRLDQQDNNGNTPAFVAFVNNKPEVLQLIIDNEVDLALRESNTDGLLHCEASSGHTEVVKALLDAGIAVDIEGKDQMTALHYAARNGHTAVVRVLLDAGAAVNVKDKFQESVLHFAACKGHAEVATALLEAGADLTFKTKDGRTSLIIASCWGCLAVVQLLVDRGAEVNATTTEGRTALWWANNQSHTAVADYLRSRGGVE